jgi:hypothetical protein
MNDAAGRKSMRELLPTLVVLAIVGAAIFSGGHRLIWGPQSTAETTVRALSGAVVFVVLAVAFNKMRRGRQ